MVLPLAIALMAAGGYRKYKQAGLDEQEAAEAAQAKREDRAFMLGERARIVKQRDDIAAAAAPTTVDETPMAMPIGSRDEPRAPEDVGIRAAGKTFTNRADADKAAAEYNAPTARMTRQADVLDQAGDPMAAQNLRTTMRQGQLADLNLKTAEGAADRDKKLRELGGELIKGGWSAVPAVYDRYNDGHSAKVIEDGKGGATVVKIGPDGGEVGRRQFASLPEFFSLVAGQFDPKLWLDREDKKAETDRVQANLDRDFTQRKGESDRDYQLRKDEAARRAKHDERMLANDSARVGIARMAASRDEPTPVTATAESTFDRKTATDIAKDQAQKDADKFRDEGKGVMPPAEIAKRTDAIVQAHYARHAAQFEQAVIRRDLAAAQNDPAAYAVAFEKATKYGATLGDLAKLGFKPPQRVPVSGGPEAQTGWGRRPVAAMAQPSEAQPVVPPPPVSPRAARDRAIAEVAAQEAKATADPEIADLTRKAELSGDPRTRRALNIQIQQIRTTRYGL